MKERLLDIMKWGLILLIAGAIFYAVCPKYEFSGVRIKFNTITGEVQNCIYSKDKDIREWVDLCK
jgi:hypothetical protein